jgi:cell fate (sporulation/competence/biofilm development) regulator YlbF (YheA/YmcA/DUF963 family)
MTATQGLTNESGGRQERITIQPAGAGAGDLDLQAFSAADALGVTLRESAEFAALVGADRDLAADEAAQAAMEAFQRRQDELRMELTFRTLTDEHKAELEHLQTVMYEVPSVAAYLRAQAALADLCRQAAAVVSAEIGIDFAANCGSSCCG